MNVSGAKRDVGNNRLPCVRVNTDLCAAEIYLHGGHVTGFHPRDQKTPVLWMSKSSLFQPGKPIRGGVPICFPWFGPKANDPNAPAHGLARLLDWSIESVQEGESGAIIVAMQLGSGEATTKWWPADFAAHLVVSFGSVLTIQLAVQNLGTAPIHFEEALHSYFLVGDVRRTEVRGLENGTYLDRLQPGKKFQQNNEPIRFSSETDRSYVGTSEAVTIIDPVLRRRIVNRKSGSLSSVVWNPWIEKARAMKDFGDDEWPGMLCVETANVVDDAITLAPSATHTMSVEILAENLD